MVCKASVTSWFQAGPAQSFSLAGRSQQGRSGGGQGSDGRQRIHDFVGQHPGQALPGFGLFFFQFDLDVLQRNQFIELVMQLEFGGIQGQLQNLHRIVPV